MVIVYNVGVIPEFFNNRMNGFLINPYDTEAFGDTILSFFEIEALFNKMTRNCNKLAYKRYDSQQQAQKYF